MTLNDSCDLIVLNMIGWHLRLIFRWRVLSSSFWWWNENHSRWNWCFFRNIRIIGVSSCRILIKWFICWLFIRRWWYSWPTTRRMPHWTSSSSTSFSHLNYRLLPISDPINLKLSEKVDILIVLFQYHFKHERELLFILTFVILVFDVEILYLFNCIERYCWYWSS